MIIPPAEIKAAVKEITHKKKEASVDDRVEWVALTLSAPGAELINR